MACTQNFNVSSRIDSQPFLKEVLRYQMFFIANNAQNHNRCRKFCVHDCWNFWKGQYIAAHSSEKNQSMFFLSGCFSLFNSLFNLIKQLSLVVCDINWPLLITYDLERFSRTVLRIMASETLRSFAIDLIDFWGFLSKIV